MGKPRLIILIRHAQSEGNRDKLIHQHTPDHRVELTPLGCEQAREAGRKLRKLLRPDDTLHFFTSPYKRTRQTTEGILSTLTSDDPSPSPFPRHTIKVYEEPRLREQDFGNFQPSAAEMERMWRERAEYGHFFYRIANGESAADAYDRVSGFNDSLWRRFGEEDFASVCIIVTHGLMARVFLMKWYHFSVEYFEDLRNIEHTEFLVMKRSTHSGRYILQNELRTWSALQQERAARGSVSQGSIITPTEPSIPMRTTWTTCPEGCALPQHNHDSDRPRPRALPRRKNTADLFTDDNEAGSRTPPRLLNPSLLAERSDYSTQAGPSSRDETLQSIHEEDRKTPIPFQDPLQNFSISQASVDEALRSRLPPLGGRDGGGSRSGAASPFDSSEEEGEADPAVPLSTRDGLENRSTFVTQLPYRSLTKALRGELGSSDNRPMADALGDQSDAELEETDCDIQDSQRQKKELDKIMADEVRDRSVEGSAYEQHGYL